MEEQQEKNTISLPQPPQFLIPPSEEEKKVLYYNEDLKDFNKRITHKLWHLWTSFDAIRNNQKLMDLLNEKTDDLESDTFFLKTIIVQTLDRNAKILSNTDLLEEIRFFGSS